MILLRALHKDISRYNALEAQVSCSVLMVRHHSEACIFVYRRMCRKIMVGNWYMEMSLDLLIMQ